MKRRYRRKPMKHYIDVCIYYRGLDWQEDRAFCRLAKKYHGRFGGSGYFFPKGERDQDFMFKLRVSANAFARAAKKVCRCRVEVESREEVQKREAEHEAWKRVRKARRAKKRGARR
jgi:hypothetical protein